MLQSSPEDSRIPDSANSGGQNELPSDIANRLTTAFASASPLYTRAGLSAILTSIGDAVLVTNAQGQVMLLNSVAERLTGWTNTEAIGVDSARVFDILNEQTRQTVESPISRVLREGTVVGLANHTILRRRDGTEIAIDDSGAPVRDNNGALVGVVLVFRDISERRKIEDTIQEQIRLSALGADIGYALTQNRNASDALSRCAQVVAERLDAALARIWTLDPSGEILELRASTGQCGHHGHREQPGCLPVRQFKTGRIAQERTPYLTNTVIGDPFIDDQEWARREGMAAFAGYPLLVEDRLLGVLEMFARHSLTEATLSSLAVVANVLALDIDRRQNEQALTVSAERLQLATASANIGTWDLDPVTDILFWDARCRAAFGYPLDLPIDYPTCLSLIHPDDRERTNAAVENALSPSGTGQYAVECRTIGYLDGIERWVRVEGQALFNEDHSQALRFVGTIRDISEAKRSEQALHETRTRLDVALLAGNIATWTWDIVNNRVFADTHLARLFSISPEEAEGGKLEVYLKNIHPTDRERVSDIIRQAIAHGDSFEAEYRVVLPDGSDRWLVARGEIARDSEGNPTSLPGVVLDITERVQREQRELFLAEIAQETYGLTDPLAVIIRVVNRVGTFLKVDRCVFAEIDMKADRATIHEEYRSRDTIPPLVGMVRFSDFGNYLVSECVAGHIVAVDDVRNDSVRVPPETREAYLAFEIASHVAVPAIYGGALVGVMAIHRVTPCHWRSEDLELLRTVVERMWLAVENARLNRETKLRAERESLLNQVGAAVRATLDPEEILQSAVSLLGQGLRADRCYFVRADQIRHTSRVSPEWYRADAELEPLSGRTFQNITYATHRDPAYSTVRTHVLQDADEYGPEEAVSFQAVRVRSRIRVPIEIGGQLAALSVAMADTIRYWTEDEVRLVENVASLVRSALETAHTRQRERNIAQQLQDALIPPLPTDLPGLIIRGHYKPALEEASVGGDFYDVFSLEAGKTALVVGDLSGKGLKAASEVATVRNMVRFSLYADTSLSQAITTLDHILAERNLLTGFATMFVGVYDEGGRTLTYVNCGQEPALLWRAATKTMDMLPPTGPVLGGFESVDGFEQNQIPLSAGDVLAIFTDGLTDVGPNRKAHLNIEGVGELFQEYCKNFPGPTNSTASSTDISDISDTAQGVADYLINAVDSYGKGGIRDDIALLVAILAGPDVGSSV